MIPGTAAGCPDSCAYTNVCKAQWTEAVLQRRVGYVPPQPCFLSYRKMCFKLLLLKVLQATELWRVLIIQDDNGFYLDNASLIMALNQKNSVNYVNLFTFLTNMHIITNSNSIWISWNVSKPAAQNKIWSQLLVWSSDLLRPRNLLSFFKRAAFV